MGSIVLAGLLNFRLSLIIYGVVAVVMVLIVTSMKLSYPLYSKLQAATDRLNSVVQEYLIGIRPIKAFGTYREEEERFAGANDALYKASINRPACYHIELANYDACGRRRHRNGFGNRRLDVRARSSRPGDISAFIIYMSQILGSLMTMTNIFNTFVRTKASTGISTRCLRARDDFAGGGIADVRFNTLEFRGVRFTYPTASSSEKARPALDGISFTVKRGGTLAVIGPTGSGKSTLCALLLRFYDVGSGEILIDGRPISDYNVEALP